MGQRSSLPLLGDGTLEATEVVLGRSSTIVTGDGSQGPVMEVGVETGHNTVVNTRVGLQTSTDVGLIVSV